MNSLKDQFYENLVKISEENNNKIKIPLENIKKIFGEVYKVDFYQSISDWSELMPTLKSLENEKKIILPKNEDQYLNLNKYRMPKYVRLIKSLEKKEELDWKRFLWHPKLSWVPKIKRMNKITLQRLKKINNFLKSHPSKLLPISEKERSLQIFGDEKELVKLASSTSMKNDKKTHIFDVTSCFPTFEPLIGFRFLNSKSNIVIFLENRDTFLSMSKVCYVLPEPPYKGVFYGQGLNFKTSVLSIPFELEKGLTVEYFGDIDPTGFIIPWEAKKSLLNDDRDYDFYLSKRLYHKLIEIHKQGKYNFQATEKRKINDECLNFLSEIDKDYIITLFQNNQRIPQELLNLGEIYKLYSDKSIPSELFIPHITFLKKLYSLIKDKK